MEGELVPCAVCGGGGKMIFYCCNGCNSPSNPFWTAAANGGNFVAAAAAQQFFIAAMAAIERKTALENCCNGWAIAAICDPQPVIKRRRDTPLRARFFSGSGHENVVSLPVVFSCKGAYEQHNTEHGRSVVILDGILDRFREDRALLDKMRPVSDTTSFAMPSLS
jgi:hypothetical protein